jgi:hypothetical protein
MKQKTKETLFAFLISTILIAGTIILVFGYWS